MFNEVTNLNCLIRILNECSFNSRHKCACNYIDFSVLFSMMRYFIKQKKEFSLSIPMTQTQTTNRIVKEQNIAVAAYLQPYENNIHFSLDPSLDELHTIRYN